MNLARLAELLPGVEAPSDRFFRIVEARFAGEIEETAHSVLYSWRYNPKGEFGVLYLSSSAGCAYREKLRQVHGQADSLPPLVVGRFDVRLTRCLDLTDASVLECLLIEAGELTSPVDFSNTQAIAREARRLGFEAIVAPSAVGADCHTLVVFKDRLAPPAYCLGDPASVHPYP